MSFPSDPGTGAKKRDYWFTVLLTDPVALPAARFLARKRWLSPDQVTVLALVCGLATGVPFAAGTRWGLVAGALLFYAAFVFDCIDGKLARALQTSGPRGEALDRLADGGRRASATLGLVLHLWRTDRPSVLWAVVYAVLAYYFLEISGAKRGDAAEGIGGRISAALARRRLLPNPGMPDVQAVVFIFGPLLGRVVASLAVGIAMVLAAILLTVVRRLRRGDPNQPGTPGTTGSDRLGDREEDQRQAGDPNQLGTPGTTGSDRLGDREEEK